MKRLIILILSTTLVLVAAILFKSKSASIKSKSPLLLHQFNITTLGGETIAFDRHHFPKRLVLNFYSSTCDLCQAEIPEIMSFSQKTNVKVIFITADPVQAMQTFESDLKENFSKGSENVLVARINLNDALKLFGDVTVPQTISFEDSLVIKQVKKGLVSNHYLRKVFE